MKLSKRAQEIVTEINKGGTKLGDLRTIAKEIKKDHQLAEELWSTGEFLPQMLAILIFDKKELDTNSIDNLIKDIEQHQVDDERLQLIDWLMANQLTKEKKFISLILTWQNDPSALKRRIFYYYQARLRWTGQIPPDNTKELLAVIENTMLNESPEVQWAMNFTVGWIGVFEKNYRDCCVKLGEKFGLYKDDIVSRNCTPNYLPKFIEIEVNKRSL